MNATPDYFVQLDQIRATGLEYALNGIKAGETTPEESPLSGEWADSLTGQDVLDAAGISAHFDTLEEFEQSDILDAWEGGYYSAPWPGHADWIESAITRGQLSPAARDMSTEDIVTMYAEVNALELSDAIAELRAELD